jgi:cell division protein FtsL
VGGTVSNIVMDIERKRKRQATYTKCNVKRRVLATTVAVEKQEVLHIVCVFVCVALVMLHAMRMHRVIRGLRRSTVFFHIIS